MSQARALGLADHETGLCPCGCGNPIAVASDPSQPFRIESYVCRAKKAVKQVDRMNAAKNKDAPEGWDDGLTYYAVPVDDDRPPEQRGASRAH